ncbi:MAG: sigma-54-dependent Fis family transcriptional regulator [Deltaproteobacteria bacterium]|nr:sigma-54-dependent Fis family transcriptional regulator [Deltaproteobacteria bacterium]
MRRGRVLIVDDEPNILSSLKRALEIEDFSVTTTRGGAEALERLTKEGLDIVLLDVAMPEMDGLEVLGQIKKKYRGIPVVMMSGHSTIETAMQATKLGAYDFVEKPLSTDRLLITLDNALKLSRLCEENATLRAAASGETEMLGSSDAMRKIFETIAKAAPTQGRVLISGENGTGKELVARAIHRGSLRVDRPFIKVNCAAIPHDLIESELFGHEKGAFTGATRQRKGKFERADGGTIFLDEIGDMSLSAQAKVLRALQEGEIERVGGEAIQVDVRVLAATNKKMAEEITAARFREDLFYRLNVVPIELPALRQRRADIPLLASHFLHQACILHGKREKSISEEALSLLMQQKWPGNVRELRNSIERLAILCDGDIGVEEVKEVFPKSKRVRSHYGRGVTLKDMLVGAEREIVLQALEDNDGQVSKTAEALGLERSHLYKKMKALGIDHRA